MLFVLAVLTAAVGDGRACSPGPAWGTRPLAMRARNVVRLDEGRLVFNGVPVSDTVLRRYFKAGARLSPRPGLVIDTSGMTCAETRRIVADAEAAGGCTPDLCSAYPIVRGAVPPAPPPPGGKWP